MSKQEHCSTCGNPIPDWANGACYACERIRFREPRTWRKESTRPERQKYFIPADASEPDWKLAVKNHLNGINALLKDVYKRDVRISQLMYKSGIPSSQIDRWSKRKSWILAFLLRVEEELRDLLGRVRPDCNPHILRQRYVDGLSMMEIAKKSKQPNKELEDDYQFIMAYLQSRRGIKALEEIIVKCTRFEP
jgi:hypothetical protein